MLTTALTLTLLATSALARTEAQAQQALQKQRYDHALRFPGQPVEAFIMDEGSRPNPYYNAEAYTGLKTFGRFTLPARCLTVDNSTKFDVAILGAPFDTATSYRPGARFGPNGIRQASQLVGGYNRVQGIDPFTEMKIIDCGDVPMSLFDNHYALKQLEDGYSELISRPTFAEKKETNITANGLVPPRVLVLGGDHTITLPHLRALAPVYGPVTVIHFDSHLDTWEGTYPITHGNYFWVAYKEGLLAKESNMHVGIKNGMWNRTHHNDDGDTMSGWDRVYAEEIDDIGVKGVVKRIRDRVGNNPVYLTLDIDVVDPSFAPATGTPATGGYTPREVVRILQGLKGLKFIGADVVEVAPAYDNVAETTSILAASIAYELLTLMALTPL